MDLIFANQPNYVIDSEFIISHSHHQIVYCILNLNIKFFLPYEQQSSDYNKGDIDRNKNQVNKKIMFYQKNVDQKGTVLSKTLINIFSNFVLNKLSTCDNRDPSQMNEFIKNDIKWKNTIYEDYIKNGRTRTSYFKLQSAISVLFLDY